MKTLLQELRSLSVYMQDDDVVDKSKLKKVAKKKEKDSPIITKTDINRSNNKYKKPSLPYHLNPKN
jgi:hypothetical protein